LSADAAEQNGGGGASRAGGGRDELCDLSAAELAVRIRRKDVSAREVMAAHLARIERVNPKVNAIVTLVADRALADAAAPMNSPRRGERSDRSTACRSPTRI
jgi:amidase